MPSPADPISRFFPLTAAMSGTPKRVDAERVSLLKASRGHDMGLAKALATQTAMPGVLRGHDC